MLRLDGLQVYYGEIHALKGVSLEVQRGEIVALLGNNGAGKTTTLKTISGLLVPRQGSIQLEDRPLVGTPPHDVVGLGIGHVPEGRRIFNRLTVRENLMMGAFLRSDGGIDADLQRVFALFPRLSERITQVAGTLSGGEQQMLAIGRALMARPRLLLLDEPSLGLAPTVVDQVFAAIRAIHDEGVAILLVEQNVAQALAIANRAYVLEEGRIVAAGPPSTLLAESRIQEAYLGKIGGSEQAAQ